MDFRAAAIKLGNCKLSQGSCSALAEQMGFKLLSSGGYGAAYLHHKTGVVLKVAFSLADGSMGFISKCAEYWQKHRKAPLHCVEVYEFGKLKKFWYAVMEYVNVGEVIDHDHEYNSGFKNAVKDSIVHWLTPNNLIDVHKYGYFPFDLHGGNYGTSRDGTRFCVFDPFGSGTHVRKYRANVQAPRQYGPQLKGVHHVG